MCIRDSSLTHWSILYILPTWITFNRRLLICYLSIKVDWTVIADKVHETVSTYVVDLELIIKENRVPIVLITSVAIYFPDDLGTREWTDFYHEGTLSCISCFLYASKVAVGLDMSEDGLGSVEDILS